MREWLRCGFMVCAGDRVGVTRWGGVGKEGQGKARRVVRRTLRVGLWTPLRTSP